MYGLEACPYGLDSGPNSCKMCSPEVREDCDGKTCNGEWYAKDIKQIRAGEIPKAEIWTFGFPCTDISISGRMAGLHGERSGSMSILWTKKVERLCCFFKFLILLLLWCQITNRAMYPLTIIPAFYVFKDCSAGFL